MSLVRTVGLQIPPPHRRSSLLAFNLFQGLWGQLLIGPLPEVLTEAKLNVSTSLERYCAMFDGWWA